MTCLIVLNRNPQIGKSIKFIDLLLRRATESKMMTVLSNKVIDEVVKVYIKLKKI